MKPTENNSILKHRLKFAMHLDIAILKFETQRMHHFWRKRNYQTLNTTAKTFSKSRQQVQAANNEFSVILESSFNRINLQPDSVKVDREESILEDGLRVWTNILPIKTLKRIPQYCRHKMQIWTMLRVERRHPKFEKVTTTTYYLKINRRLKKIISPNSKIQT